MDHMVLLFQQKMNKEKLIAEISDDQIRYILCQYNADSEYKVLSKRTSVNTGIINGKILSVGGRVLNCTSIGNDLLKVRERIIKNVKKS